MARPSRGLVLAALTASLIVVGAVSGGMSAAVSAAVHRPAEVTEVTIVPPTIHSVTAAPDLSALLAEEQPPDMAHLEERLQAYLKTLDGTWGVYVLDIDSGRTVAINADRPFLAASTFKVPMAMYVLSLVERGRADLSDPVTYDPVDWEEGAGSLQSFVTEGSNFPVGELIERAIVESDNIATNMLVRHFGMANIRQFMRALGGSVMVSEEGRNATTPREMAGYLEALYTRQAIEDRELRLHLLDLLQNTIYQQRIPAGVPESVPVANKVGTLAGFVNDVGLVMLPRYPYILSVYSEGVDEGPGTAAIAEISRIVYEFQAGRLE